MQKRQYGKTDNYLSVIGFGGIVVSQVTPEEAASSVSKAIDLGINYFDVAPSYDNAEERLGPALKPYRDDVFLACKTMQRSAEGAEAEMKNSFKLLHTDHFDLYQLHAVTTQEEVNQILAPGGALEFYLKAREQGLIRYIGFSAHTEEAALALFEAFDFDSILMPVNYFCWNEGNFGSTAVNKALEKDAAILALKSLAQRPWLENEERDRPKCWYKPLETLDEAVHALSFTLSKPVTAAIAPGYADLLWLACDAIEQIENGNQPILEQQNFEGQPLFPVQI